MAETAARVLVPLAQGCEELEAVTIIDLLRRAGVEVTVAGLDDQPVVASRGTRLIPDCDLDQALDGDYDMVVLPGGLPGADHLEEDRRLGELLQRMNHSGRFIGAICAAPKVLAASGILNDRQATAYPGVLEACGHSDISGKAVVRDGHVVTSRGPGTAMDFALALIELLCGAERRGAVESGLQR